MNLSQSFSVFSRRSVKLPCNFAQVAQSSFQRVRRRAQRTAHQSYGSILSPHGAHTTGGSPGAKEGRASYALAR